MKATNLIALTAAGLVAAAGAAQAQSRDQIRIVGSSTVFPFATAVAEQFGRTTDFPTPVIESTGSGGGLKLFCAGVGVEHPDISNASRRMKPSEFDMCQENGVTEITEVVVGYDGIVVANAQSAPEFELTLAQIWQALAKNGPKPEMWSDIDPSLPVVEIEVLGPPPTSGTRDAFEELAMEAGCEAAGGEDCGGAGAEIREDGPYVEAGENDNLIVSKIDANPNALGVFGYSFLDQNQDKLKGATINGVEPTFEAIGDGSYPVSRSMYFYIKKAHVGVVPGIMDYVSEFISDEAAGSEGYLADKGLIPLPEEKFAAQTADVMALKSLSKSDLE
ncbi:MAG: PstS family phosphate ABC transporter substrate-binding protein [Pseudomonadota bacterium]